jgi:CheY-like chemotaxis protein
MPDGGTLTIATRPAVGGGPEPDIPPGRFVEISVADTGVGMSRDLRSRVFEPFFTTKGLGKGTGLGLSTVYGIVSRANGHVRLETAVSRGTTIRVFLPECASDPAPAQTLAAALPTGAGETILLADDESPVAELAARILKRAGYVVLQATSGEDAVKLYDAHPYTVDLLITDCVMPGMSGVALATQLRERDALLPVLFMSGYTDQLGELKAFKGGHCGELAKPFAPDALVQGATALLAKRVQ